MGETEQDKKKIIMTTTTFYTERVYSAAIV